MYHYRPDIDGLRAVAVIPVLLFHAGMNYFSGGYIGVDIFFVVSGYLITSIIVVELEKEKFTILGFYERRVRRIFPALFTVIFFSIIVSQFLMLPNEYKDFGQSVFATTFFLSNVLFWIEAGYFDAESLMKPLLHTWSLAVEEQYYIFYPPLLILIYKLFNKKGFPLIAGLWVASLAWSVWSTYRHPSMAYYLAPSRVWELLTGAMLALGYVKQIENRHANEVIGITGVLMVGYAVFGFDHTTHFPGYAALIPCVGTAMVIYSGESHDTLVSKLLTSRPLIFTGLISYSLYLWHWPILVFANLYQDKPIEPWQIVILLGLAYLFAWISWRFVEKPFRGKQSKYTRKQMFAGAFTVMAGVSAFGLTLHLTEGLPVRMPDHVNQIVDLMESYHSYLPENCLLKGGGKMGKDFTLCDLGEAGDNAGKTPSAVLWGDSHAASLVPGLTKLKNQFESLSFKFTGMQGCPPLNGVSVATNEDTRYDKCTEFNDIVLQKLTADDSVKVVILSAYWALYENGVRMQTDPNHGSVYLCESENCTALSTGDNSKLMKQGLKNIIELLVASGKKVILIGPIPELEINGAATIARMELLDKVREVRSHWKSVKSRMQGSIAVLNDLQDGNDITSVFPHRVLCGDDFCEVETKDMPLYNDRHHLSPVGSVFVLDELGIANILSSKLTPADNTSNLSRRAYNN